MRWFRIFPPVGGYWLVFAAYCKIVKECLIWDGISNYLDRTQFLHSKTSRVQLKLQDQLTLC